MPTHTERWTTLLRQPDLSLVQWRMHLDAEKDELCFFFFFFLPRTHSQGLELSVFILPYVRFLGRDVILAKAFCFL